jgi:tetratricopeptide (TPR) repeat protein
MNIARAQCAASSITPETRGDAFRKKGQIEQAIEAYLDGVAAPPSAALCLKLARCYEQMANYAEACRWALSIVDAGDDFTSWQAGWALFQRNAQKARRPAARSVKVALLGSYTTTQLGPMLCLAAGRLGIHIDLYESRYGQYQQDILDHKSGLYAFSPNIVVLAVHEGDLHLPEYSQRPKRRFAKK